ncbi:MAG: hypothetical protein IPP76_01145 [Moraxellaceae bacterium]|nr:hypothetical protein [Moraxellaceae bacterium]
MTAKVHVIPQSDLVALHKIAGTVRVLHDILMSTSGDITLTNKALFSMIGGMANDLEEITQHINNGEY